MKPKHRRLAYITGGVVLLGAATALVLSAFQDNLVFFYSPSDLVEREVEPGRRFRLGGLVEEGSLRRDGATVHFVVTDLVRTVPVSYTGVLPDLFREDRPSSVLRPWRYGATRRDHPPPPSMASDTCP